MLSRGSDREASHPDVYIKLLGPGEPVRLSSAAGFGPAWSPDGRFVAFLRPVDQWHAAVVVIPAVGGQEREVTRMTFDASFIVDRYGWPVPAPFLAWSPDGKWLLTLDQQSPGKSQPHAIVRVSVETGEKRILTSPPPATLGDGGLALAPDGKRLAFTQDSGFWARDIYIVPVSGDLLLRWKTRKSNVRQQGHCGYCLDRRREVPGFLISSQWKARIVEDPAAAGKPCRAVEFDRR